MQVVCELVAGVMRFVLLGFKFSGDILQMLQMILSDVPSSIATIVLQAMCPFGVFYIEFGVVS